SATQSADANASPLYKRCTLNAIPQNATLLGKSKIPFGLLVTPYRQLQEGDPEIPVINSPQIVRCRRCRTYINPWVSFVEQGARWKCNVCTLTNEVPSFFDWDDKTRQRVDRMMRPELTHGVVEYVAPQEYMVRPPQPVVMMFLIDVSIGAVQSGMLAVACKAISESLSKIPDAENRAKVGFVTFDSALHYYNLSSALQEPQMLVVPDLEEPFLPLPYDLLVSLNESKDMVEMLLEKLPRMFQSNTTTLSCTGKALKSVEKMLSPIGGKIILLQQALPNMDEGQLKVREEPKMIGTPKETQLLQPAIPFYKNFAVDCSPNQISVDLFMFNAQYQDVATLNGLARFTGGNVYYYPGFNANRPEDAAKFASELKQHLTRPLGLEAVLRVRASSGIKMTSYHGNFFLRSTDLLALPSVNPDNCYCIEMQVVENLNNPTVCFQSALLHTSSNGERRIRVITLSVPVTTSMAEIYSSADPIAIAALLGKKAVERSLTSKLEDAREALFYKLVEILGQYKAAFNQGTHPAQLMIADNLQLLPLLIIGIIKNFAFKISSTTPTDHRSYALAMQYVYSPEMAVDSFVPRFYKLDTLITDPQIGMPDLENKIVFPPRLNLSSEKLDRENLFLLDNGSEIFIWIGRNVSPQIMTQLFGVETVAQLPAAKITLPRLENELSLRFNNLIQDIRTRRLKMMTLYPHLYVIRDEMDLNVRSWFLSHLIEDRTESALSYPQFLATVRDKMPKSK
ncbi:Sec23/Sec24 trunk domain-containing protein, partial [Gorgonomyces haynaldii]